jgi:aerotolerance regulator-like protein
MPGLVFLHPALLWGLALGGLPILIHLLQRRRHRVRRWAAMEFLRVSVRKSSRRLRIEQWLLLLVRALILILAALALARPVWHSPRWSWLGSRAASQVVLVVDDSYGMGWRDGGTGRGGDGATGRGGDGGTGRTGERGGVGEQETQFDVARARALELIRDGLTPGDSVSLVLASAPAHALLRRPTFNLKEVAAQLQRASPSDRPADLAGAARLSLEILRSSRSAAREVYVFTNAQAVDWRQPDAPDAWRRVAAMSHLYVIPTAPARGQNLAVDEVRVDAPVAAGRLTPIQARISNWGEQPSRGVVVTLHADGQAVASARIDLPANGTAEARFEHTFAATGPHTVKVSLPGDGLAVDDSGYASVLARDHVRVLLLNGHPDPDPRRDAAFFVAAALAPAGWAEGSGAGDQGSAGNSADPWPLTPDPFGVRVLDGSTLRGEDLSRWDVVILADVPRLADPERRRLASFVADGGGVLILPGPSALSSFYNGALLSRTPALMPARLGPAWEAGADAPALDLARADHPALARFRNAADVDLTTARFQRFFRLTALDPASGARILCRFTDGSPALAERSVGLGRVALLASPPLPGWSTLPFKPAFLPFLDGLIDYLGQGPNSHRNLRVGDPLVWAVPDAGRAFAVAGGADQTRISTGAGDDRGDTVPILAGPDGRRVAVLLQSTGAGPAEARVLRVDAVPRAGFYHIRSGVQAFGRSGIQAFGADNDRPVFDFAGAERPNARTPERLLEDDWIAANLNTAGSDLRSLTRAQLEGVLRPAAIRWVDPHESLASVVPEGRQGREAWRGLLLAAMALMLCESGMAQLFGRRRGDG